MSARTIVSFGVALCLAAGAASVRAGTPMGTAMTYQGQVKDAGKPVDGDADMMFSLYDGESGGVQVGATLTFDGQLANPGPVALDNGLFMVRLDFGTGMFTGDACWLKVELRYPHDPTDTQPYTVLSPRHELTPSPHSLYAKEAGSVSDGITGSGTANYVPKRTGGLSLGDSAIYDSSGRIGVGLTGPTASLHVHRADAAPDKPLFRLTNATSGTTLYNGIELGFWTENSGDTFLVNWENGFLSLGTGGQDRIRVLANGNVGIGTITAQNKLDVDGTLAVGAGYAGSSSGPSNGLIVEGNVGIGTDDPQGALDVYGGDSETDALYVRNSGSSRRGGILLHQSSTYAWHQYTSNTSSTVHGRLHFEFVDRATPDTQRSANVLVLRANGEVGIMTDATTATLDVNGTARIRNLPSSGVGTAVVADGSGNLSKLSSSRRYKNEIESLSVDPDRVLKLRPVQFTWKTTQQPDVGLIAEEVAEVLPELVIRDEDGRPDAVRYDLVAVYLLDVVAEQNRRIEELERSVGLHDTAGQSMEMIH